MLCATLPSVRPWLRLSMISPFLALEIVNIVYKSKFPKLSIETQTSGGMKMIRDFQCHK